MQFCVRIWFVLEMNICQSKLYDSQKKGWSKAIYISTNNEIQLEEYQILWKFSEPPFIQAFHFGLIFTTRAPNIDTFFTFCNEKNAYKTPVYLLVTLVYC